MCNFLIDCLYLYSQIDSSALRNPENNERNKESVFKEIQEDLTYPDSRGKRKTVSGSSRAPSRPAKGAKVLRPRSPVWEHYTRTKDNRDKCVCHNSKRLLLVQLNRELLTCPSIFKPANYMKCGKMAESRIRQSLAKKVK